MVSTEIRLIIFFAAKDGEALHSQEKQDQELTVAQIMTSLLPNSPKWLSGEALQIAVKRREVKSKGEKER